MQKWSRHLFYRGKANSIRVCGEHLANNRMLSVDCWYFQENLHTIRLCRVDSLQRRMPNSVRMYHTFSLASRPHMLFAFKCKPDFNRVRIISFAHSRNRGFGQRVRCVWRNKELIPKGEDVKLITQWKHAPGTIGYHFLWFSLKFLYESIIIFYIKISQIKCTRNGTPFSKFCTNF